MSREKHLFLSAMSERRMFKRGSTEWQYLTRAARTYAWMMRGVPSKDWHHEPA